jgi:alpha 1,2-mannosyltransferase
VDVAGIIAESLPIDSEIAPSDPPPEQEEPRPTFSYRRRANATLVMLCRNSDINGVVSSIQQMEDRFNKIYNYPWVLLNEEPFTEEFKRCWGLISHCIKIADRKKRRVSVLTEAPLTFGQIPPEHWYQPDWIDEDRARQERMKMERNNIIYGGSHLKASLHLNLANPICCASSLGSLS